MGPRIVERAARLCRSIKPRRLAGGAAFTGYLTLSFCYFGIPVIDHPKGTVVGGLFTDPQIFVWAFAWWPHAVAHGQNPFVTHAIWAPSGFNLAWATSVPGLAVVFAPVTLVLGPILAYNLACIVMPALAAWAAFLLCRHITGVLWPSLVGGYLFGFSSYNLGGELSHLNTVAVFCLPLTALLVLRFLEGDLSPPKFVVALGALLAYQAYLWTELLFTLTLALGSSLLLGLVFVPTLRPRVAELAWRIACAYALAGVLAAPLLYYALTGLDSRPQQASESFVADSLNFIIPTRASFGGWWSTGLASHFPANDVERGAYLGVPTLVIVCSFALSRWRTAGGRFLIASFAVAAISSLGSWLTFNGHRMLVLPWSHIAFRPLFEDIMPVRFSVFVSLVVAVMVALWTASRSLPAWLRVVAAGLAVVAVLPNVSWSGWARTPRVPTLFTTDLYRNCIGRGENVLLLPFGTLGDSMIWQADSDFWFTVAGGYISPSPPPAFSRPRAVQQIAAEGVPPKITSAKVRQFVRLKDVSSIVVDGVDGSVWRPVLARLAEPQAVSGALIYRFSPEAPRLARACARAQVAARTH